MGLKEDLIKEVESIFKGSWSVRDGQKVPEPEDIALGKHAVRLDATVLYADLSESTDLVNDYKDWFAAEIYKSYLHCAAKVIRQAGGTITSYDGDRIMAVFIGDGKNSAAAECGLKINYAVKKIIQPAIKAAYPKTKYVMKQVVGIDTSRLFVARTGIRGSNDLVWVGRSANYAAILCTQSTDRPTWITKDVFARLNAKAKYSSDNELMWSKSYWTERKMDVYYSTWRRSI